MVDIALEEMYGVRYYHTDHIQSFYPDENYLQNKEKEQSLKEVIVRPSKLNLSNYFPWMRTK